MDGFRKGLPAAVCLWGLNLQDNGAARRSGLLEGGGAAESTGGDAAPLQTP